MRLLTWISKHIVLAIIIGMVIGFFLGLIFDTSSLRVMVTPLSVLMVFPMMVTLNFRSVFEKGSMKLQLTTQAINFIYLPLLALLFGLVFFSNEPAFRIAILLIALLPTSGMTVSWTVMAGGNVKEAIRMIVIGLTLGGLLTPIYLALFMGETANVETVQVFRQIGLIVFLPMFLGFLTQTALKRRYGVEKFKKRLKPVFPKFSTLAVVILISTVMSLRAPMIAAQPSIAFIILGPVALGYLTMLVSIHAIGKWLFTRDDRIALINGTMIRSLSLALAIALSVFGDLGESIALVVAVAYMVQVQLAAWYVKREIRLAVIK